ncbi:MAG: hypothetical protein JJT78_12320 [Leptospira sp.]|nr:hypothetical protein [Leptospira sp.]
MLYYISFLILISIWLLSIHPEFYRFFYSADALYLPVLFQDLFQNGISIREWNLQPSPGFFPDWLAFSPIYLFLFDYPYLLNPFFSVSLSGVLFYFTLKILGIPYSYQNKEENRKSWFLVIFSILMIFVVTGQGKELITYVFLGTHHIGAVISSLILAFILLKKDSKPKLSDLFFFIIFLYLLRLSNEIILIISFVPLSVAIILSNSLKNKKTYYLLGGMIIHFLSYPYIHKLYRSYLKVPHFQPEKLVWNQLKSKELNVDFWVTNFHKLLELLNSVYNRLDFLSNSFLILCLASIVGFFLQSLLKIDKSDFQHLKNPFIRNPRIFISTFIFAGTMFQIISILALSLFWQEETIFSFRYYTPLLIYGLISISFLLENINLNSLSLFIIAIILSFSFFSVYSIYDYSFYKYPPLECAKQLSDKENLNRKLNGISGYWDAKPMSYWSKGKFNTTAMYDTNIYNWVSPTYQHNKNTKYFFILEAENKHWDSARLRNQLPPASDIYECSGWTLYYYRNGFSF